MRVCACVQRFFDWHDDLTKEARARAAYAMPPPKKKNNVITVENNKAKSAEEKKTKKEEKKEEEEKKTTIKKKRGELPSGPLCLKKRHPGQSKLAINGGGSGGADGRYSRCARLGSGTYGDVFLCWDCVERCHVAIKYFKTDADNDEMPQSALREITILRRCNHPNIIRVIDTLFGAQHLQHEKETYVGGFIMPFFDGGDLHHYAVKHFSPAQQPALPVGEALPVEQKEGGDGRENDDKGGEKEKKDGEKEAASSSSSSSKSAKHPYPLHLARKLGKQLYSGLAYLHERGIIHRDIKPQNIMIDASGSRATIADFGLGRMCSVPLGPYYSGTCCTLWYRPPELLLGDRKYGVEIDLWSMALVMHEMIDGSPFYGGNGEYDQLLGIFRQMGTPTDAEWPGVQLLPEYKSTTFPQYKQRDAALECHAAHGDDCVDFMRRSLVYRPCDRLSARRATQHPFFDVVEEEVVAEEEKEKPKRRTTRAQAVKERLSPPHRIAFAARAPVRRKRSLSAPASTSPPTRLLRHGAPKKRCKSRGDDKNGGSVDDD